MANVTIRRNLSIFEDLSLPAFLKIRNELKERNIKLRHFNVFYRQWKARQDQLENDSSDGRQLTIDCLIELVNYPECPELKAWVFGAEQWPETRKCSLSTEVEVAAAVLRYSRLYQLDRALTDILVGKRLTRDGYRTYEDFQSEMQSSSLLLFTLEERDGRPRWVTSIRPVSAEILDGLDLNRLVECIVCQKVVYRERGGKRNKYCSDNCGNKYRSMRFWKKNRDAYNRERREKYRKKNPKQ